MLNIFTLFIISIIFSLIITLLIKKLFYKLNILDNPKKYNKKRKPVPYSTGIILFICFFILSYFGVEHNQKLYLIWGFGFIITVISFVDDLFNVSAKKRLIIQIIIGAVIGITSIKIGYVSNIFGGILDLETYFIEILNFKIFIIPVIFTIFWYVFIFNTVNWTDGITGNTSGLSIISFLILFLLGYILFLKDNYDGGIRNAEFIMHITIILIGILIPYWYFEVREKILMGDSGTMFLGFMLATIAIISGGKVATVLVVFGIYAVDTVYVVLNRLMSGKSPLKGDLTHLHHRLLKLGLSKKKF
ncbi:MAG: MraY family glycosyltransferase [Candidatus Gracilibacteria bacterium]|nr:MraY family glycosyltransferase [Candidatus Gracilibacteria bacterium]